MCDLAGVASAGLFSPTMLAKHKVGSSADELPTGICGGRVSFD